MEETPLVSIVILTKNGGSLFREAIDRIVSQKASFPYEVVIIDSGSTDDTLKFLEGFPVRVFKFEPKDFSFGPARDFGFSKALGEYIATLSQDVVPVDDHWLQNLATPLIDGEADVVQGNNILPEGGKIFFWERIGMFYFTSEGKEFVRLNGGMGLSCTNLAVKKKVWEEIKFGSIHWGEDKLFQKNIHAKGYRMIFQKNARAYHSHFYNLRSLIKRCENEGAGWRWIGVKYSFAQMLKDLMQKRWVYGRLIRGILKREIKNLAELLYLFIRPIFVYRGNLLAGKNKF